MPLIRLPDMKSKSKSKAFGIFLFLVSLAGVVDASSIYKPDFRAADISGWDDVNGGDVIVTYDLTAGAAVPGLGSAFTMTYNFSPFTGIVGSGYEMELTTGPFNNTLGIRPDDIFQGPAPVVGSQWGTTIAVQAPPAAPVGWNLQSEELTFGWFGFLGAANSETLADVTPGFNAPQNYSHGSPIALSWEVIAGGFAGSGRFDSNGRLFTVSNEPTEGTHIAYRPVPEPSSFLLLGLAGVCLTFRRRGVAFGPTAR